MKKKLYYLILFTVLIAMLSGCSRVEKRKDSFNDEGIYYEFQLPKNWKKVKDPVEEFNDIAVFGGKDTESESSMFVIVQGKGKLSLKGIQKDMEEELKYIYEKDDVKREKFEIKGYKANQYKIGTHRKSKKVWAYIYHIETENGIVQMVYYSEKDKGDKVRIKEIESSVRTIDEKKVLESEKNKSDEKYSDSKDTKKDDSEENNQEELDQSEEDNKETVLLENEEYSFEIQGYKIVEDEVYGNNLAIKFEFKNKAGEEKEARSWYNLVEAKQDKKKLEMGMLSSMMEEDTAEIDYLNSMGLEKIVEGGSTESVALYILSSEEEVALSFPNEIFGEQEDIKIDIKRLDLEKMR